MHRKWFRLELPPQDRLIGAAFVFAIFAVAYRKLTGLPPVGVSTEDLAFFYTELLIFPVLVSLLTAALLWLAVYVGCLWAGVPQRAFSFTAILLGTSIVVCGALLYGAYCLERSQHYWVATTLRLVLLAGQGL